ncbi:MAG: hypothetical protein PVI52_06815 [Chromatiales bacterium]|jgi:hypothetical protein
MTEIGNSIGKDMSSGQGRGLPVKLKKDYSVLPQRPIKLKAGIGGLVEPPHNSIDNDSVKRPDKPAPIPPQLRPAKKPRKSTTQWTLRGVSPGAREAAVAAAKERGIPVGEWIDEAIFLALTPADKPSDPNQQVFDRLENIQARLERIERQPVWWERLVQFLKTCVDYGRSA